MQDMKNSKGQPEQIAGSKLQYCIPQYMPSWISETKPAYTPYLLYRTTNCLQFVEASWNVMAHAQKPDFVFRAKRTESI